MRSKLALLLIIAAVPALADVKDSAANGFNISTSFTVKGTPAEVYRKISSVGDWWTPEHTFSGDPHNFTLDARAGGCWCEKVPKASGSVMHMQVATALPGSLLVLTGAIGPLQQMGVSGAMTFKLTSANGGTRVDFTYIATGYVPQGMNTLAPMVDKVLMEAMTRFRNYADLGDPAPRK